MGVLAFDGTNDRAFASTLASPLANLPGGGWTCAFVVKRRGTGTFDSLGYLRTAGTAVAGLSFRSDSELLADIAGGFPSGTILSNTTSTYVVVVSRPAGANTDLTYSWYLRSTPGWTHVTRTASSTADVAQLADELELGTWEAGDFGHIFLGVAGFWAREISQTEKESLTTNWQTSDWHGVSGGAPVCLVECNTTTLSDLEGNATSWTLSGPTLDAGETLDSWNFDGTGSVTPTVVVRRELIVPNTAVVRSAVY